MTYLKSMSPRHTIPTFVLSALLALALALPAAAAQPQAKSDYLIAVEDQDLVFAPQELMANDVFSGETEFSIAEAPRKGSLVCTPSACTYTPLAGWYGVDTFRYAVLDDGVYLEALVQVWVSPLVTPISGDWNGDGLTDLGWFHATRLDFYFADLQRVGGTFSVQQVSCAHPPLPTGAAGWMPVTGNWDGDLRDDVGLFDPVSRTFYLYLRDGAGWQLASQFQHPDPGSGGSPVAGDWNGSGGDEVGLYLPGQESFRLLVANQDGSAVAESFTFTLAPGRWFPVAAKWGATTGADRVGVWGPGRRELHYRLDYAGGATEVIDDYDQLGVGLRALPFGGVWLQVESVGFFDPDATTSEPWPGAFRLFPCDLDPSSNCWLSLGGLEPVLLPVPEDPLGAVCVP